MTRTAGGEFDIRPAPPAWQQAALELVLAEVPAERRAAHIAWLMNSARASDLEGLLVAQRGGRLVGATWVQRQPGRVATVWSPRARQARWSACADDLLAEVVSRLESLDVRLAQALLAIDATDTVARFERHGFTRLAELVYMVSLAEQFPTSAPQTELRLEAAPLGDDDRLASILDRTYERTLDCPTLDGVRDSHDVLTGYRACGVFEPARWFIVRRGAQDVGCLLLADHPEQDQWEIVYIGVIPEERGRRSGLALVRQAQFLTRQAKRSRLVLAVDAANAPALSMYTVAGFLEWDRRSAFFRVVPSGG